MKHCPLWSSLCCQSFPNEIFDWKVLPRATFKMKTVFQFILKNVNDWLGNIFRDFHWSWACDQHMPRTGFGDRSHLSLQQTLRLRWTLFPVFIHLFARSLKSDSLLQTTDSVARWHENWYFLNYLMNKLLRGHQGFKLKLLAYKTTR